MNKWGELASQEAVEKTLSALKANGIEAQVVENGKVAKKKVLELLPKAAEVMTMTSMTLETIGLAQEINGSGRFNSTRNKLMSMDREKEVSQMRRLGTSPEWVIGSIHAVTEEGNVLIASASGSQLPAYSYGAGKVIWIVGTQKIVKDTEEGIRRIYEYSLPLEDKRARKAYGMGSGVNKILIINKEMQPERITIILVKEQLGF